MLTLERGTRLDPRRWREAVRRADFTPNAVVATVRGTVEAAPDALRLSIPGALLGPEAERRRVSTAGRLLILPETEQELIVLRADETAPADPGTTVEMTGRVFAGSELGGVPPPLADAVFLLPRERSPPGGS